MKKKITGHYQKNLFICKRNLLTKEGNSRAGKKIKFLLNLYAIINLRRIKPFQWEIKNLCDHIMFNNQSTTQFIALMLKIPHN